jgi:hypothetical protein
LIGPLFPTFPGFLVRELRDSHWRVPASDITIAKQGDGVLSMGISRRGVLGRAVAVAGLSLLPETVRAAAEQGRPFGVITIAVTGISATIFRIDTARLKGGTGGSGFERLGLRRVDSADSLAYTPLRPGADAAAVAGTADIVAQKIARLKADFPLADDAIAIVGSSGLRSYAGSAVEELPAQVKARTGIAMRLLSPTEEAQLEYDWIVPADERDAVLHIEIAGADTKGGYYSRQGGRRFYHDLSVPFGTRNFAGAVKFRYPEVRTDDFGARAADHYRELIVPMLQPQIDSTPEVMRRPKIYLTGGIVWAMTVILYPQQMAEKKDWQPLSAEDFGRLRKLVEAGTPYGRGLPDSLAGEQRAWVVRTLGFIRNIFNPHQLAAGAELGAGLAEQLAFATRREIAFPSFANGASGSQYLLYRLVGDRRFAPA